jgi:hypothetical protein
MAARPACCRCGGRFRGAMNRAATFLGGSCVGTRRCRNGPRPARLCRTGLGCPCGLALRFEPSRSLSRAHPEDADGSVGGGCVGVLDLRTARHCILNFPSSSCGRRIKVFLSPFPRRSPPYEGRPREVSGPSLPSVPSDARRARKVAARPSLDCGTRKQDGFGALRQARSPHPAEGGANRRAALRRPSPNSGRG